MSDYVISVEIPVETSVVTVSKTASTASITGISVDLSGYYPMYKISIALKDDDGVVISSKRVELNHPQCQELMPNIDDVLASCRNAIEVNMPILLSK